MKAKAQLWYEKNREKHLERKKKYADAHKEEISQYNKDYYLKNKKKIAERKKLLWKRKKEEKNARNNLTIKKESFII